MKIMKVKGPKSSLEYHPGSSPSLDTEYTEWKVVASLPPPSYGISSGLKTISQVGVTPPWRCCWACIVRGRCLARETPSHSPTDSEKTQGLRPSSQIYWIKLSKAEAQAQVSQAPQVFLMHSPGQEAWPKEKNQAIRVGLSRIKPYLCQALFTWLRITH